MVLEDKLNKANCYYNGKLNYRVQSTQTDYIKGVEGYCLCEATQCRYFYDTTVENECKAPIKRHFYGYKRGRK